MSNDRTSRDAVTRDQSQRVKAWQPPQTLPTPHPQDGWVFRWIRTSMVGQSDPTNASAKFREGWAPVRAEDHPELQYMADPTSKFQGNVEIGGLLLCKAPKEMLMQRDAYYRKQNIAQMEAVDNNFMQANDPRMPLFAEKRSATSFGRGQK